jgi:hypothetical protein
MMPDQTTKKHSTTTPVAPDDQLQVVLERILELEAQQYAAILEQTPPEKMTAAMLTSARQFLESNGVSLDTLRRPGRGAAATARMVEQLREFCDDEDDDGDQRSDQHPSDQSQRGRGDEDRLPPLPTVESNAMEK